jgi:uracil phosphoribosyltransferase
MSNLHILNHPLLQHKISILRDKNTGAKEFRELSAEIAMLITYEATRDLPLRTIKVETPVAVAETNVIAGRKIALVPIMRAGLGMVDGALALIPAAKVGHIGLCRDNSNHNSNHNSTQNSGDRSGKLLEYYCKLPFDIDERDCLVMDLMLATGNTAVHALKRLFESKIKSAKFMCVIACPEGVKALTDAFPDVEIYCGALDAGLTDDLYITPGIGDGGDRIYGTK